MPKHYDWSGAIKKRLLIRRLPVQTLIEVTVVEVSPAGRVKFQYQNGDTGWGEGNEFEVVEELAPHTIPFARNVTLVRSQGTPDGL